ncbi:MAG: exosortase/archaeosortase family protein, partial [Chlamydiia bacterium]|nr:exosortase/archaeosortase family protein [Chlamydiia bacterium]
MQQDNMTPKDTRILGLLIVLAAFIWIRDTSWMSTADDTLPILIAIPVFVWLGWPWTFLKEEKPLPAWGIFGTALLFLAGIVSDLTVLLAIGWCVLVWAFIRTRIDPELHDMSRKLMVLPLIAFPWITLDAEKLGWWFRLSGAWVTGEVFHALGYAVVTEGTFLHINGQPISVEPACSGLNTLQSMMISGSMMAYVLLGETSRYWISLPFLVVLAWLANTIRIMVLTTAAILISPEFAMGWFHDWGGWFILVLMFLLAWGVFSLAASPEP